MLPDTIKVSLQESDLNDAVCGSPTRCVISTALHRMFPTSSYRKTNMNQATISINNKIYHYALDNAALKIVMLNDDGTLTLSKNPKCMLTLIGKPRNIPVITRERQTKVNANRTARKNAGKPDKKYGPNPRVLAAKAANKAYKKLVAKTA